MASNAQSIAARRTADLVIDVHGDETVVLDTRTDAVHCLPAEIAAVWSACDGTRTAVEIATTTGVDLAVVESSVAQLVDVDLLDAQGLDRRRFLRRAVLAGGSLAVLPVIQSIVAPVITAAASNVRSCHAVVTQTGCTKNKAEYDLTVSGLSPNTTYKVVVSYKNGSVSDAFNIVTNSAGSSVSSHVTGAAIPQGGVMDVEIQVYTLSGGLVCQDVGRVFHECKKDD